MVLCYILLSILIIILCIYFLFEVHYFLRCIYHRILAKVKRKISIHSKTTLNGICLTTDIDTFFTHMNNARFIRELDFAKADFFERTGVFNALCKRGGLIALNATTIRYRRFIKLFARFLLTTQMIYWDENTIFLEHRFIDPKSDFINAIAISRIRLINCDCKTLMDDLKGKDVENGSENEKDEIPVMPEDLSKWIEYNELSSAKLRGQS